MADDSLALIFNALAGADKQAQESNPWAGLEGASDGIGKLIMQQAASGKYGLGESIGSSLLAGLVGGATSGLGQSYVDKQNKLAQDYLLNAGDISAKPDGLNDSIFNSLKKSRSIFQLANEMDAAQESRKAANELQKEVVSAKLKGLFDNPYKYEKAMEIYSGQQKGPVAADPGEAGSLATPATPADNHPVGATAQPAVSLDSYLRKFGGDETLAREAFKKEVLDKPATNEERIAALRKELQGRPEFQTFSIADTGIKSLRNAIKDPSATSDLELIRGAIQAIEPGMAVREGEAAAVQNSASIPDAWKGILNKSLTGGTALPAEVREGILRIAERRYVEQASKYNQALKFYGSEADRLGLPKESISFLPEAQLNPPQAADTAPTGTPSSMRVFSPAPGIKIVQGQEYHLKQGQWVKVNR